MSRTLVVNTFLTLDGVMQGPGGPEEDPTGGFTHGGWSATYWDDSLGDWVGPYMARPADMLLGRRTYEIFAAHWPYVGNDHPDASMAEVLNAARKYVASTTLDAVEWNNATLLTGDVAEAVAALKEEDGPEIQVHGSGNLIQTLLRHDLVDEFRLIVFPLVLGAGKRLFSEGTIPANLKVVDSTVTPKGVVGAIYRRAGAVEYGSFAFEEPTEAELARREKVAREG
jgi:dihydrofolate reductase